MYYRFTTNVLLAQAKPCVTRAGVELPLIGIMEFNTAAAGNVDALTALAKHELAHVLGFGTIWHDPDLPGGAPLQKPSVNDDGAETTGQDTHFAGLSAATEFGELNNGHYSGSGVPVENDTGRYDAGQLDAHWRYEVFCDTELMGHAPAANTPVSKVTLASLEDLGYTVNYAKADADFDLPEVTTPRCSPPMSGARGSLRGATLTAADHHDDLWHGSIEVVNGAGHVVRVIERH